MQRSSSISSAKFYSNTIRGLKAQAQSRAKYPLHTKPVLSALHTALSVYDAYQAKGEHEEKTWQLFDEVTTVRFFYVVRVTYKGG